jgi:hypothetical protein
MSAAITCAVTEKAICKEIVEERRPCWKVSFEKEFGGEWLLIKLGAFD